MSTVISTRGGQARNFHGGVKPFIPIVGGQALFPIGRVIPLDGVLIPSVGVKALGMGLHCDSLAKLVRPDSFTIYCKAKIQLDSVIVAILSLIRYSRTSVFCANATCAPSPVEPGSMQSIYAIRCALSTETENIGENPYTI